MAFLVHGVETAMRRAMEALLLRQQRNGHWVFALEGDVSITAEYVLLMHYLGRSFDHLLQARLKRYLHVQQRTDGGWSQLKGGDFDLNVTVKAYFALKLLGDAQHDAHMHRACVLIRQRGGAEQSGVMVRIWLALYRVIPWRVLPLVPVELVLIPRWFPFNLSRFFCTARLFMVPLAIIQALRPLPAVTVDLEALFIKPASETRSLPRVSHQNRFLFGLFSVLNDVLHISARWCPKRLRRKAIERALEYIITRLNGVDGYGATLPTIGFSLVVLNNLQVPRDQEAVDMAHKALEALLVVSGDQAFCQPCVSPLWDTAWACQALLETRDASALKSVSAAIQWLMQRQILDGHGDWASNRPGLQPGGWAFQYNLPDHPDIDDTAVAGQVMQRYLQANAIEVPDVAESLARARGWIEGMQSHNGGWAAYMADNTQSYLNSLPFAEHGLMIDPPSADICARSLAMLGQMGESADTSQIVAKGLAFLLAEQKVDGSWYGRWGMNFIYGTWSALEALSAIGHNLHSPAVQKARDWLIGTQNDDGGWGEDASAYTSSMCSSTASLSTPSQTAWALLGLMAAGAVKHQATVSGVDFLLRSQTHHASWSDSHATGTAIPGALYLHYHGYALYFPLWALARYHRLLSSHGE